MNLIRLCCLVFGPFLLLQTDNRLENIRSKYQQINANLHTYKQIETDPEWKSTEGGAITGYFLKDSIMLIVEDVFGEMARARTEIYFDKGAPIFIFSRDYSYSVPMYDSSFNDTKIKVKEDRAYFYNNKMIRWIDNQKTVFLSRNKAYIEYEQNCLKEAKHLYERILAAAKRQ